jgi:hypothetical protein
MEIQEITINDTEPIFRLARLRIYLRTKKIIFTWTEMRISEIGKIPILIFWRADGNNTSKILILAKKNIF